jgi:cell division protein FtsW (lipid II flippase)
MSVTLTRAAERDARPRPAAGAFLRGPLDLRLAAISLIAILGVVLTAAARLSIVSAPGPPGVNLNAVRDARQLEKPLEAVFDNAGDRRFAAVQLFSFLMAAGERRAVANVGAIGRAQVPVADVRRARDVEQYTTRIRGQDAARSIPLLTPQDVAQLKPSLIVRTRGVFLRTLFWWTLAYVAAFHAVSIWWWRTRGGDRVLLAAAHLLTAIGLCAMIARPDPLRDLLLFTRFAQTVCIAAGVMALVAALDFRSPEVRHFTYAPLVAAMGLSILLLLFGRGPGTSNARVNLGPVQPIEGIRLLLVMFLAGYLARRWELLRQLRQTTFRSRAIPSWLDVPRAEYAVPVVSGVAAALGLLFLQKDLGPALILGLLFLSMYAIARGRLGMPLFGLGLLLLGFYASYRLQIPPTVVDRVRIWQSPWDNGVRGGDQIAHAIWTLASGGPGGAGLGLGATRYLPAGHTDLVLASIGEELGIAGLAAIAALYTAIVWRALRIARAASTDYEFFLAIGAMLLVIGPVLLMASAMVGVAPLTGVVTPFLSYGGSAMTANFAALGVLASIRSHAAPGRASEPFDRPVRWLTAALVVAAALPLAAIVTVQAVRADEYAVKPHLGLQADGSRRYEYNPRILDAVRQIPRGSVLDRTGLPLATDDPDIRRKASAAYERLGVSVDVACPQPSSRCYPLGGQAFHLLGDARSRVNWAASNTSFVERDDESKLRGFDDHAQAIRVSGDGAPESWTIRRDYRPVLPLLRHRYQPDHPAVKALLDRPRDVRLTIDARLQMKVAAILQSYARLSDTGRAAAVVVEAESGDVLASVSYPWPAMTSEGVDVSNQPALLDRARYGLYPPGSTFKLVTAAATLRQNPRASETRFACVPLPDGRVGARIPGWARPIRDDVKDKRAHGVIDMHAAMIVSCNAYFAQLALKTGPQAIADAARAIGVTLARGNAPDRIRETLPQIGYGQGDVLVAPTKMAQIAAAIATGGRIVDLQIEPEPRDRRSGAWLAPSTARLLASYMRDVVLTGTGHALRDHAVPIAGKTGTAELTGADSHAWFVGFAPYAPAPRHLAFAVLIENAGYGGAAAAPAAGEIVTAAASLGLMGKNSQ